VTDAALGTVPLDEPEFDSYLPFDLVDGVREVANLFPTLRLPARAAAAHALRHIRRAWRLRSVDREMAVFRAITAEEEAATALIRSLRRIGYIGAKVLDERNHQIKAGVWPMILAINNVIAKAQLPIELHVDTYERDRRPHLGFTFVSLMTAKGFSVTTA
jgi:hypothetical protein